MLALLLGLTLTAPPDTRVEVEHFKGKSVTVQLRSAKHRVELRDILPDVEVPGGTHQLKESDPVQLPGPLLLVECSKHNLPDGPVVVLGASGLKVKGPKRYSVFALEPFATRFPGGRLRMLKDNGAAILTANTVEVVQVPEDYRYLWITGLEPTAKYRVKVAGPPGPAQVLILADRAVAQSEDSKPADAAWSASRLVLRGGGSAALPSTGQIALTLAGLAGAPGSSTEVTIEQVSPATAAGAVVPLHDGGSRAEAFLITVARQLLAQQQPGGARPLLEQCLHQAPNNAECHLLYAQAWQQFGDSRTMQKHACLAAASDNGVTIGEQARALLGGDLSVCR